MDRTIVFPNFAASFWAAGGEARVGWDLPQKSRTPSWTLCTTQLKRTAVWSRSVRGRGSLYHRHRRLIQEVRRSPRFLLTHRCRVDRRQMILLWQLVSFVVRPTNWNQPGISCIVDLYVFVFGQVDKVIRGTSHVSRRVNCKGNKLAVRDSVLKLSILNPLLNDTRRPLCNLGTRPGCCHSERIARSILKSWVRSF